MDVMHRHLHHHQPPHTSPSPPSRLNPNAPIFVPMKSYLTVEDFSDQWWELIHSSPFFRDYWLQDCFVDDYASQTEPDLPEYDDLFPDSDAFFELCLQHQQPPEEIAEEEGEEEQRRDKELITLGALNWSRSAKADAPRCFEKVPKIVKNVKMNPRTIHQPR